MGGQRRVGCRPPRGEKIGEKGGCTIHVQAPRDAVKGLVDERWEGWWKEGRRERGAEGEGGGREERAVWGQGRPESCSPHPGAEKAPRWQGMGCGGLGCSGGGGGWVGVGSRTGHGPRAWLVGVGWLVVCGGWGGGGRSYLGLLAAAPLGCWMRGHSSRGKGKRKRKGWGSGRSF